MKIWSLVFSVMGILPWTFIVSLSAFYIKVGQMIGYAPRYNNPDPGDLSIYSVYSPYIDVGFTLWFYSFVLLIPLTVLYYFRSRKETRWELILLNAVGHSVAFALIMSGIFEWYVD